MTARRITIDFQRIINGDYLEKDLLLVYQWLMSLGGKCDEQFGWHRYGLHKSFHGYSHNNNPAEIYKLDGDYVRTIYDGLVRLLCKTNHPKIVADFLIENRIQLGKKRAITVTETGENEYFGQLVMRNDLVYVDIARTLRHLTIAYKGLELRNELFHRDYERRQRPRILDNVRFGTNGGKWYVWFSFSFECFDYEPGWDYTISQEENEDLCSFFSRAIEEIDGLLLPFTNCDNCPMWIECNRGSFLRHGYRGSCKRYTECGLPGVVKYHWEGKDGRTVDNATHHSIVFPYFRKKE